MELHVDVGDDDARAGRAAIFALLAAQDGGREVYADEISRVIARILNLPTLEEQARELLVLVNGAVDIAFALAAYLAERTGVEARHIVDVVEAALEPVSDESGCEQTNT